VSLSDDLCRSYLDLRWHFDPAAATLAGITEHDGRLGQFDRAAIREHLAAFRGIEAGIEELGVDDAADELDRTALLDDVRVTIFRIQHERPQIQNPAFWLLHLCEALHGLMPRGQVSGDRALAALARLKAVPAFLVAAEETLDEPPAVFVDVARELFSPAAHLVTRLLHECGPAMPDQAAALAAAGADAHASLARFRLALDTELSAHADEHAFAAGDEHFERLLHYQHAVSAGAPELWRVVSRLEEEVESELRAIAGQAGHGVDWRAMLEAHLLSLPPWSDPGTAAARELARIDAFVRERDVMASLTDGLEAEPLPGFLVPITCQATYLPPPLRGPGSARLWLRETPITQAFLSPLVAESGWPGLHLQTLWSRRLPSEIRGHLGNSLVRGGWGLYAMEMLDEAGYWADPVEHLVARAHLLLRLLLARIDVGLHTSQLSLDEAVRVLTDRLPFDDEHALAAVRGCCLEPTQAVGAIIGRRELRRIRDERRQETRGRLSLRGVHDEILEYGGLPAPLIRWGMGLEG
jgi:uncharacterized protein (DUF885 family)